MIPQKDIYRTCKGPVHVLVLTHCLDRGCIPCAYVDRDAMGEPDDRAVTVAWHIVHDLPSFKLFLYT